MAKFLWKASYTIDGVKGVMKDGGTGRRDAVKKLVESAGGTMEAFYFAFGDADVYVIVDLPDNAAAAGVSAAVNSSGAVELGTVTLLTPEEMDAAVKKAVDYQAPGSLAGPLGHEEAHRRPGGRTTCGWANPAAGSMRSYADTG